MTLSVTELISLATLVLGGMWAVLKLLLGDKLSKINSMDAKQGEILASLAALNVRVAEVVPLREQVMFHGRDIVELRVRSADTVKDVDAAHQLIRELKQG
jgi:hypothetical protein